METTKRNLFSRIYASSPAISQIKDESKIKHLFSHWRYRMFWSMFFGYFFLYFGRKNISATYPLLSKEFGYSNTDIGLVGMTLYITYGVGKFLNGILADRANIRTFMATSLILSGLCNFIFGGVVGIWAMAFVWGLNGWVQSMGFPPIAKGLTIWFEPKGNATRWALWTTSHQAGTAVVAALTGAILFYSGNNWRLCLYIPGAICILAGVGLLFTLGDTPQSKGLPKVVCFEADKDEDKLKNYWSVFFRRVILNWQLWVIALINMCVYVIRYGTFDWAPKLLVDIKGYPTSTAAGMAAFIPLFGIAGVLVAGSVSDVIFKGRFKFVNAIMLFLLIFALPIFYYAPSSSYIIDIACLAVIGFLVEGPQSILGGIASVDVGGSARIASSAAGLVGIFGYAGATMSSIVTGMLVDKYGWKGGFTFWTICAIVGFILCTFFWKSRPSAKACPK